MTKKKKSSSITLKSAPLERGVSAYFPRVPNLRIQTIFFTLFLLFFLVGIILIGFFYAKEATQTNFSQRNLAPSFAYPFGTDWLGRNMLYRTLAGLSLSLTLGMVTALLSAILATLIGIVAAMGSKLLDASINWLIDLVMGIPHLVLLILISFALGGGAKGLMVGIILTHWTGLARLVRSEVLQLRSLHYIKASHQFGKSNGWIIRHHLLPHMTSVFTVGVILLLPHVILHEAAISFLGYGLPPEQPAIGIILSESMKYVISGMWWLAVFPGSLLVLVVFMFDRLGDNVRKLLDPISSQE